MSYIYAAIWKCAITCIHDMVNYFMLKMLVCQHYTPSDQAKMIMSGKYLKRRVRNLLNIYIDDVNIDDVLASGTDTDHNLLYNAGNSISEFFKREVIYFIITADRFEYPYFDRMCLFEVLPEYLNAHMIPDLANIVLGYAYD